MAELTKDIRLRFLANESELDKSIQSIQNKLQKINKSNNQINEISETGGVLSKRAQYAQKVFQKSTVSELQKESRELEQKQRTEMQALMQKQRDLRAIEDSEESITEEKQKQLDILKEEINLKAKQIMDIETSKSKVDRTISQIQGDSDGKPGSGGPGGGKPNQSKAMQMFKDLLKSIGVASVLNGAINFAQHRIERDRKVLADQGQTAQMASRELREMAQGQGMRGLFFGQERADAMKMSAEEQKGMGRLDFAKLAAGTAAGAAGGSFIPGLGTAVGAGIGAVGAFGGMMAGSDRLYNRVFDQDAYRQMLTREGMQKYEANRAMMEMKNPMKSMAIESLNNNVGRDVQLERTLGLGNRDLYGQNSKKTKVEDILNIFEPSFNLATAGTGNTKKNGMLVEGLDPYQTGSAFKREDLEKSIQSLIGAGATTEGARELASKSMQYQRNLRLQNAPEIMGKMTAAGLSADQTEDTTKRLMAEAVKLGVDASKMPQEMQKMTAVTAELVTQGGGQSMQAAENFMAGLTGFTDSEIGGAKSAFQEMQDRAKTAGGFEGQMGMGFLMGEGALEAFGKDAAGKIKGDSKLMNYLNQMSAEDLERSPALQGIMEKLGFEGKEGKEKFLAGMRQKDEFKQTRTSSQAEASKKLGERMEGMNPQERKEFIESKEGSALYANASIEDVAAFGTRESGKTMAERRAAVVGRAVRSVGGRVEGTGNEMEDLQKTLQSKPQSELEEVRSAQATGDQVKGEAVRKEMDNLLQSARTHSAAAEMYNVQFQKFIQFAKESGDALEQMSGQLETVLEKLAEGGVNPSAGPSQ